MIRNCKKIYVLVIFLLNVAVSVFTILNILNWNSKYNVIFFFVFSKAIWFLSLVCSILSAHKLFNWFYLMMTPLVNNATPEFFATSQYLLSRDKAYRRLLYTTIVLLVFFMIIELILFLANILIR